MVKLKIEGIVLNLVNNAPVVILKTSDGKVLPIAIGIFEAQSILMKLEKLNFPRPLTHDLIKDIIRHMNGVLEKVEIHSLRDSVYKADLVIKRNADVKKIDCRPSDGIALALRFNAPIYASEKLLEEADIIRYYDGDDFLKSNKLDKPIEKNEAENFRKIIENISAEDFWKKIKGE